jgi:hypothetical protein
MTRYIEWPHESSGPDRGGCIAGGREGERHIRKRRQRQRVESLEQRIDLGAKL